MQPPGRLRDADAGAPEPSAAPESFGVVLGAEAPGAVGSAHASCDAVVCDRLAYSFGDTRAVDGLDLAVREGARRRPGAHAVRRLLGTSRSSLSADSGLTRREKRRPGLAAVGLADAADRLAGTCSGGMVRRLDLAEALVGLDPIARTGVGSTSTPYAPPPA